MLAMPGSMKNGKHEGLHRLIKWGAKLVENVGNIIEKRLPKLDGSAVDQVKNAASEQALAKQGTEAPALVTESSILIDELLAPADFLPATLM